jgi:hypothetical protein
LTAIDRTPARRLAVLGLAATLLVAACGGAATPSATTSLPTAVPATTAPATPTAAPATPSTTPKPTPVPTIGPSPSSSADLGGFAFSTDEVFAYYKGVGYECQAPTASTQAAGYTVQRCLLTDDAKGLTTLVALVFTADGVTGNAFAGVLGSDGTTLPTPADSAEMLGGFLGAMLGQERGATAMTWLAQHLGEVSAQTTVGDILVATYSVTDETGAGLYVEVANQAFMDAPTP